ncbi:LysR substrate-binding domain-containing protein [Alisedimentitalea sp. MJ-SS2]|uniref:LysR substrate-binding domain-containing protein n=1 Tax=Aliisedimentitalea sp. MJ-SS2 TaxID=3049795 RepID=UPI002905FBD8|nr:LysR substrate-binding domain-containing protein [Alisedimentitalea sp. MJ-SS2]MDU8925928.1 LysR substrate-binding domain-containing protein [Alisedimentitalea sp. MJ-SS2]
MTALRTFEVAARRLSFKDAADELCVSATTVSNQIRQLEADWNCKLFIRQTRAVVLTDEGRSLSQVVTRAFDEIRAEVEVHMNPARKSVTLAVGPIFGSRWLVPRLARFREAHPRIDLVLHESPRITDAAMMTSHLAVDWGTGNWSGLNSQKLLDITYSPVVRADVIDAFGGLKEPSDLTRIPLIHQRDKSEWSAWFKLAGMADFEPVAETTIRDSNLVLQAALDGQGAALGVFPFVSNDIGSARLVKPFDIDLIPQRSFYLLSRPSSPRTREVSVVQNWLLEQAARSPD